MTKSILIVEDDLSTLKTLVERCLKSGLGIAQAVDGESALKEALERHPDLILLDLVLPKMDGITMLRKLREDDWGKTVEVMILTNLSENKRVAEAMGLGAFEYLIKSDWDVDEVMGKIKNKLRIS
ncbi:MAG: response regulator [Patescibacteria group bacterium]|nr:response regulator [Patescibacteria group bacterium]